MMAISCGSTLAYLSTAEDAEDAEAGMLGTNEITERIIKASMADHTIVGPGLLERAYDTCFFYELSKTEMQFEHQVKLPVVYQTVRLDAGFRVDYIVENRVLVELKAVDALKCQGMLFPNEKNLLSASSASSAVKSIGRCRI